MRNYITIIILFVSLTVIKGQVGPAHGVLPEGYLVNTNDFKSTENVNGKINLFLNASLNQKKGIKQTVYPENFMRDAAFTNTKDEVRDSVIMFNTFDGINDYSYSAADATIAVGPNHIIQLINALIRISDKEGNTIQTINPVDWFNPHTASVYICDPKIIYDHFAKRWVMSWIYVNTTSNIDYQYLSVSDDDNPLGEWYNYVFKESLFGNDPVDTWGDYPGLGYDDKAVYIVDNEITPALEIKGSKVRIFPKDDLYKHTGDSLHYTDFLFEDTFMIRPVRMQTASENYYLARIQEYGGDTFEIYTLKNPVENPEFEKTILNVNPYTDTPHHQQLGGNYITGGGCTLYHEPYYSNGKVHTAFIEGNGDYIVLRYLCAEVEDSMEMVKDVSMGEDGYYYYYPAIAATGNGDAVITYSRSADTEYIGAYYTIVKPNDDFLGSFVLEEGKSNYNRPSSSGYSRWSDYQGVYTDPVDNNNVWVVSEYAYAPKIWFTKVGGIRTVPFEGVKMSVIKDALDFGDVELSTQSEIQQVELINHGKENLIINSVTCTNADVSLVGSVTFPVSLASYESISLYFIITPTKTEQYEDKIIINSNDPDSSEYNIDVKVNAYRIANPQEGSIYCTGNNGKKLYRINIDDLSTYEIGALVNNDGFTSLYYDKNNKELLGSIFDYDSNETEVYRINADSGDVYLSYKLDEKYKAVTTDSNGVFYGVNIYRELYKIDPVSKEKSFIAELPVGLSCMVYDNTTQFIYGNIDEDSTNSTMLYKVNAQNGETSELGVSGLDKYFRSLVIDNNGTLYGIGIEGLTRTVVYTVDKVTGSATTFGKLNDIKLGSGFVLIPWEPVEVEEQGGILPTAFVLEQNYPNPFNPATTIKFTLPEVANVKLEIFNTLGEKVATIVNREVSAGAHSYKWNTSISKVASGVYIYKLTADGDNIKFSDTKKMILVK